MTDKRVSNTDGIVVILSGGLDSTVLLAKEVAERGAEKVKALSFNYGQRHSLELVHAKAIVSWYNVLHRVANITPFDLFQGSSQTSTNVDVPEGHYEEPSMKLTVVPNRNMVMLSIAAAYAISRGLHEIAYAAHAGDHAVYPDCRPQFVDWLNGTLEHALYKEQRVRIIAPFIQPSFQGGYGSFTKTDIVKLGAKLGVPFDLTYSCYNGREKHCGKCGTCNERREAFTLAGVEDPTEYEQ